MRVLQNIKPTPEQLPILADDGAGFRLIRGAAGSGKTTAALMRLRQLCRSRLARRARLGSDAPVRVLVLTFNRTLRGYVTQLAEEQINASVDISLTVETFAGWALKLVGSRTILEDYERRRIVGKLLASIGVAPANMEYLIDEVGYITGRFSRDERQAYIGVLRSGRGRAPAVTQSLRRRLLSDVVEKYEAEKRRIGKVDWNDIALEAAAISSQDYDVVVIDESQDFSANQIRAVLAHLNIDHVTTFIIDAVQRIYPQGFTWREIGINIRPELVFTLESNHRNTAEIARLASSLVRDLPPEADGVFPNDQACQPNGRRPLVVKGNYSDQLDYMLTCVRPYLEASETVAILQPKGGGWFDFARRALRLKNIGYCELTRNRDWPTGPELVALSTIHSAKGLEFDHVLMPGLNQEVTPHGDEDGDGTLESLRRLVAMGVGRARETVMLGYKPGEQSTVIELLDPTSFDLVEV